jgi:sulfite reductase (NADPH) hemoprotein beta-component
MAELSRNEGLKARSNYLRGTIAEGVRRQITGALAEEDTQLTKFHGFYQQDDRDLRPERAKKKLEPAYSFMIRLRLPAGVITPEQWLKLDRIATEFSNGTLRLTTRQTFQFHGIIKSNLKQTMQAIDAAALDTIAACGDVNRNVLSASNPWASRAHLAAYELARQISAHLLPRTGAWREIWLDAEKVVPAGEEEPIYGPTYMPRKFKTVIAVPPANDVDLFAQDLAFIAILDEEGTPVGWNVAVGGGMGMTHGEPQTYPRTADLLGFCTTEQVVQVAEAVLLVQRDHGDRVDRKHARLKYTIDTMGLGTFRAEVEERQGFALEEARPFEFTTTGDRLGWHQDEDGLWAFGLFVENGRIKDTPERPAMTGLRRIAAVHEGMFQLTPNQNLLITRITPGKRPEIEALLREHGLANELSGLRLNSMACVALPSCGLALAESERLLPTLVTRLEDALEETGLRDDAITIRMTGCPNGCARPYLAEIGVVGRAPGRYNLYLGASFDGRRMNKLYRRDVGEAQILEELAPLFRAYAKEREPGEHFGDFVIRTGVIRPTTAGLTFHDDLPAEVDRWGTAGA